MRSLDPTLPRYGTDLHTTAPLNFDFVRLCLAVFSASLR